MKDEREVPEEAREILSFWFDTLTVEQWWTRDEAVDATIRKRFSNLFERLAAGVPPAWLQSPRGRLAAVIALDQFPRNLFRGSPRSFATDDRALALARETVEFGLDSELSESERIFLYVPFEHSEDPADQARAIELYEQLGHVESLDFARKHKQVIDRFGRFPHRNEILGRESSEEEVAFLKSEKWFW